MGELFVAIDFDVHDVDHRLGSEPFGNGLSFIFIFCLDFELGAFAIFAIDYHLVDVFS